VRFLKICLFEGSTRFVHPAEHPIHFHPHQHGPGHPPPPPPSQPLSPSCFHSVRALAVECRVQRWKELLPRFSKFVVLKLKIPGQGDVHRCPDIYISGYSSPYTDADIVQNLVFRMRIGFGYG
jgi:hypothetical protein